MVLLIWALLTAVMPLLSSHDRVTNRQAQADWHTELPPTDLGAAAHRHDDGSAGGCQAHQSGGHCEADHSHQPLFMSPEPALIAGVDARQRAVCEWRGAASAHVPVPERPPKAAAA